MDQIKQIQQSELSVSTNKATLEQLNSANNEGSNFQGCWVNEKVQTQLSPPLSLRDILEEEKSLRKKSLATHSGSLETWTSVSKNTRHSRPEIKSPKSPKSIEKESPLSPLHPSFSKPRVEEKIDSPRSPVEKNSSIISLADYICTGKKLKRAKTKIDKNAMSQSTLNQRSNSSPGL